MEFFHARTLPNTDHASGRPLYVNNCGYYRNVSRELHTHRETGRSDYMLLFVAQGSVFRPDLNRVFSDNTIMLFRPHQLQDYVYRPADGGSHYYFLHFSGQAAPDYVDELLPEIAEADVAPLIPCLKEIIRELRTHSIGFEVRCAGLLLCLFSEIARRVRQADPSMAELTDWLNRHYAEPLTDARLDAVCGGHARSRIRQFQQYTGQTPAQYQQQLRLTEGARLLSDTDWSVRRIAEQVGYTDPLYFSRLFRRKYGKSPVHYRLND